MVPERKCDGNYAKETNISGESNAFTSTTVESGDVVGTSVRRHQA